MKGGCSSSSVRKIHCRCKNRVVTAMFASALASVVLSKYSQCTSMSIRMHLNFAFPIEFVAHLLSLAAWSSARTEEGQKGTEEESSYLVYILYQ